MHVTTSHQMGDLGRNFFTPVVNTVKRVAKVAVTPVTIVRKVAQGNIKGALKDSLDLNPAVLVAKAVSGKENIVNMARMTMPLSVANISDRDLRKKAAIGYVAAAVIVTGAAFATTGLTMTGAGEAVVGGGTIASGAKGASDALSTAGKVASLATTAKNLVGGNKKKPGEQEEAIDEGEGEGSQPFLAGMITPQNIFLFMGLSALTVAGYLLFNKPMKAMKRR